MKDLGFQAYRFSFSWPRLFPEAGTIAGDQASMAGFDFYDRLIDQQLELGLQPFATLYHWDLPSTLQDMGGWMNRDTPARFADYAAAVGARFHDRLASIATFNEPWCITYLSHMLGIHAPGYRDRRAAARAMHHVPLAHGLPCRPCAARASKYRDRFEYGTRASLLMEQPLPSKPPKIGMPSIPAGFVKGCFTAPTQIRLWRPLAQICQKDLQTICRQLQRPWIAGHNYYTRTHWQKSGDDFFDLSQTRHRQPPPIPDKHGVGTTCRRPGIFFTANGAGLYRRPAPYVTENGMAWDGLDDTIRTQYFRDHLRACKTALDQGVPLKGYFAWSLLDNYEWAEGYSQRFGLVHVDYDTQERTIKQSAKAWQHFLTQ